MSCRGPAAAVCRLLGRLEASGAPQKLVISSFITRTLGLASQACWAEWEPLLPRAGWPQAGLLGHRRCDCQVNTHRCALWNALQIKPEGLSSWLLILGHRWAGTSAPVSSPKLLLAVGPLSMSMCEFLYLLNTHCFVLLVLQTPFPSVLKVTLGSIELVHHHTNISKL